MVLKTSFPTEGFMVLLGSYVLHLAALITMVFIVRAPPAYESELRNTNAQIVFSVLILYHIALTAVDYLALWRTRYFQDKLFIFMLAVIFITGYLCINWVYGRPAGTFELNEEQQKFECWLLVEVMLVWAYILGGAIFMFFEKFTVVGQQLHLYAKVQDGEVGDDLIMQDIFMI